MTLHFGMVGNKEESTECTITRETRNWIYFTAGTYKVRYRYNKETHEVQVLPYNRTYKNLHVTFD